MHTLGYKEGDEDVADGTLESDHDEEDETDGQRRKVSKVGWM